MKKGLSEIHVILDRSGSMRGSEADMEGGFQTFLDAQRKEPGECLASLYQFDTEYETVFERRDIREVAGLKLSPRGGTALHDALGHTIDRVGARLRETPEAERPENVIFIILTDGNENSSRSYTGPQVAEKVKRQKESYNWRFIFLGADHDAVCAGTSLGTDHGSTLQFSKSRKGINATFSNLTKGVNAYRAGGAVAASFCYTNEDRALSLDEEPPVATSASVSAATSVPVTPAAPSQP